MTVTEHAFTFEHVDFSIKDTAILKNISGTIPSGKVTCLIGPSGSGKTTLLKLCNGLHSPTKGNVFIHGKDIQTYEPTQLRQIVGIALQQAPMIRGTVYDNLALPLKLHGQAVSMQQIKAMLHDVGLSTDLLNRQANDLSGGQKQRVTIARTLLNQPKILLLDEITASLDQQAALEMEQLILSINEKHRVTVVWITHDLVQAQKVGDFIWVLSDGKLIESGDLQSDGNHHRLQRLIQGGTSS